MIKICDYPCENRREAELEEDRFMTELKAYMNSHRASRTQKQYREDNKEKIQEYTKEYSKEYQETNKEKLKERRKEYYETNKEKNKIKCECGCEVTKSNLKIHQTSKKHISLMKCIKKYNILVHKIKYYCII
jgi:FKBP-type peptidyl-prolyl cis-trans isomerase